MQHLLPLALIPLLMAAPVFAQGDPLPQEIVLSFFNAAAPTGSPISNYQVLFSLWTCDADPTPPPPSLVVNPRVVSMADPSKPERECWWDMTTAGATGPILALPNGQYILRGIAVVYVDGVPFGSEMSQPSNVFLRGQGPTRPQQVKLKK
jgi:hypothetical protein